MEARWAEVPKLFNWGVGKLSKISKSHLRKGMKRKIIKNAVYI
jgi:hypothetical protein